MFSKAARHHAESNKAMGFCIYNNVAVGAAYLLHRYKYNKVAIVDYDVHHGNGTQEIFITILMFYISPHINIHFIQVQDLLMKKVLQIIF